MTARHRELHLHSSFYSICSGGHTDTSVEWPLWVRAGNSTCNEWLVRGESRSTCSFIKTKRRSNRQISSSGIEGNVDKAESKSEAEQWVRAGGRQRGLPVNQAGSERQAANDQERESNSPGSTREDKLGKTLGNVSQGKTRLRTGWVFVCCFYVSEWMRCRCGEAIRVDEWMVTAVWLV